MTLTSEDEWKIVTPLQTKKNYTGPVPRAIAHGNSGFWEADIIWQRIKEGVENQYCRRNKACSVDSGEGARIHLAQQRRQHWLHFCLRQPLRNTPRILGLRTPTNHVNQYWLIAYLITRATFLADWGIGKVGVAPKEWWHQSSMFLAQQINLKGLTLWNLSAFFYCPTVETPFALRHVL